MQRYRNADECEDSFLNNIVEINILAHSQKWTNEEEVFFEN